MASLSMKKLFQATIKQPFHFQHAGDRGDDSRAG
jgi:hypothetical protein